MNVDAHKLLRYWSGIGFATIINIVLVLWFDYPAQVLFWFLVIDLFVVITFTLAQLLRFSTVKKAYLLVGGLTVLITFIPVLLTSLAILVLQNIVQMQKLSTETLVLLVPIGLSIAEYYYISQSSQFTALYFDRNKVRVFLLFTFGTFLFASWASYATYAFGEVFKTYYELGFFAYLMYKLMFDVVVYHFFARYKPVNQHMVLKD